MSWATSRHLHARRQAQLVARDVRAGDRADDLRVDPEVRSASTSDAAVFSFCDVSGRTCSLVERVRTRASGTMYSISWSVVVAARCGQLELARLVVLVVLQRLLEVGQVVGRHDRVVDLGVLGRLLGRGLRIGLGVGEGVDRRTTASPAASASGSAFFLREREPSARPRRPRRTGPGSARCRPATAPRRAWP